MKLRTVLAVAAALTICAAGPMGPASAQGVELPNYGLNLVGTDPYQGLPAFYSAYPADYPPAYCRPARPTSHWHRWYYLNPSAACRDASVVRVEKRVLDFETDEELKRAQTIVVEIVALNKRPEPNSVKPVHGRLKPAT